MGNISLDSCVHVFNIIINIKLNKSKIFPQWETPENIFSFKMNLHIAQETMSCTVYNLTLELHCPVRNQQYQGSDGQEPGRPAWRRAVSMDNIPNFNVLVLNKAKYFINNFLQIPC